VVLSGEGFAGARDRINSLRPTGIIDRLTLARLRSILWTTVIAPTVLRLDLSAFLNSHPIFVMAKSEPVIEISADLLQRLHRIYRQRNDIQSQIDRCPRQIAAGEVQVQKCRQAVTDAIDAVKRTKMAADQKQLQLKERENRLDTLQGKLNAASSNREYDSFREQIAADKQANSVLSDEILELLERVDQLEIDRAARETEVVNRVAEHETMVTTVNERLESLRGDFARVEAERAEAESLVPAGARQEYDRLVAARGEDALAPVDGDTCGGCYQTLTTQFINRIRLSQLVRCPACNAFLYSKKTG
jgi:predicted  nucleic acid-binding Zn-ribbon protein